MKAGVDADGINIGINNKPAAGQIIFHTHIVPRFSGDGFAHWHGARGYTDGEVEQVAENIKAQLL